MASQRLPALIAFDLDGTLWCPDMYELWGGGAPFAEQAFDGVLTDKQGQPVRLLGITASIFHQLKYDPAFAHVKVAWVSCTDEPTWVYHVTGFMLD